MTHTTDILDPSTARQVAGSGSAQAGSTGKGRPIYSSFANANYQASYRQGMRLEDGLSWA